MEETVNKIVSIGTDKLDEDDFRVYNSNGHTHAIYDVLIYDYERGSYSGSGTAVWKRGDQWYYLDLIHCSCYGPTNEISSADLSPFTLAQVKEILSKNYEEQSKNVLDYLEKNY